MTLWSLLVILTSVTFCQWYLNYSTFPFKFHFDICFILLVSFIIMENLEKMLKIMLIPLYSIASHTWAMTVLNVVEFTWFMCIQLVNILSYCHIQLSEQILFIITYQCSFQVTGTVAKYQVGQTFAQCWSNLGDPLYDVKPMWHLICDVFISF